MVSAGVFAVVGRVAVVVVVVVGGEEAAEGGVAEVVEELHQAGCSIATLTSNKDTPLIIAGKTHQLSAQCS